MNYRKNGLRLLGLLAMAALSLMALAAVSAQAVTPQFLIAKKAALVATVGGKLEEKTTSSLLVTPLKFKLTCTAFTTDEGKINTTIDAKAVLLYTGCTTLTLPGGEEIACEVVEPIKAEALILPTEMIEDPVTKETLPFALLAEEIKALIKLTKVGDLEKECILPFDNIVKGEACLKIVPATNDTVAPLILSNDTIQKECKALTKLNGTWATNGVPLLGKTHEEILKAEKTVPPTAFLDELLYGTQPVTLDFAAILKLEGEHAGLTLGVSLF